MRKLPWKRIALGLLGSVATMVVVATATIYAVSEWRLSRGHEAPLSPLSPKSPIDLEEGRRMARIVGCWSGCHGPEGEGRDASIPGIVRHTAPTLSEVLPAYSDAELARLVRYGVKRDGRSALGMIAYTFWPLGDQDLANIFAHLRSQPAREPVPRVLELAPKGRIAVALGMWRTSAEAVDRSIPRWGELPRETSFERGRYLASVTCSECHGLDFHGNAQERGPSLAIVAAYSPEQFRHLLRTGEPISGRDLGIMGWTARNAFVLFTDQEIADIRTFLRVHHGLEPARE
jgi:cytochrome c553